MRCTSPKRLGLFPDNTKTFSRNSKDPSIRWHDIPCNQCISCLLNYSREWALRCTHHAYQYPENAFITLTYNDESLKGPTLVPEDFELFIRRLRAKYPYRDIDHYTCGEYGTKTSRPHWHSIIFNWLPEDKKLWAPNKHGQNLYVSQELDELWPYNSKNFPNKLGVADYGSAAYVARYAAKGLVHGTKKEQAEKGFKPVNPKTRGLGYQFLDRFRSDIFSYGYIIGPDGTKHSIPRSYERRFRDQYPSEWEDYVTRIKNPLTLKLKQMSDEKYKQWVYELENKPDLFYHTDYPLKQNEIQAQKDLRKTKEIQNQKGD